MTTAEIETMVELRAKADAGERFKSFVHSYLTQHGVPEGDPNNQHQKEGCRIGARLDLLFAERDRLRELLRPFAEATKGVEEVSSGVGVYVKLSHCRAALRELEQPQ